MLWMMTRTRHWIAQARRTPWMWRGFSAMLNTAPGQRHRAGEVQLLRRHRFHDSLGGQVSTILDADQVPKATRGQCACSWDRFNPSSLTQERDRHVTQQPSTFNDYVLIDFAFNAQ